MIIPVHPGQRFFQVLYTERSARDIMEAAAVQATRVRAARSRREERIRDLMQGEVDRPDYSMTDLEKIASRSPYDYAGGFAELAPNAALILAEVQQYQNEGQLAERLEFISKHLAGKGENPSIKMTLEDALIVFDEYGYREQPQPEVPPIEGALGEGVDLMPAVPRRVVRGMPLHTQGGGYATPPQLGIADLLKR